MGNRAVFMVVHEDGDRIDYVYNQWGAGYPDVEGSELRAFYRKMEGGGTAASHLSTAGRRREENDVFPGGRVSSDQRMRIPLPDTNVMRVFDFAHNRTYLVDLTAAIREHEEENPGWDFAARDSDDRGVIQRVLAAPDLDPPKLARASMASNYTGWSTKHDSTAANSGPIRGWDSNGDEMPMMTVDEIAAQREDALAYHGRGGDGAAPPPLAASLPAPTAAAGGGKCGAPTAAGGSCNNPVTVAGRRCSVHS